MSQYDFGLIDPDVMTGTQLALTMNQWRDALHSSHAAAARPAYVKPGMIWVEQVSATVWNVRLNVSGAVDIIVAQVNPQTGVIVAQGPYIPLVQKAAANGVASLDAAGKVPIAQLPAIARSRIQNGNFRVNQRSPGQPVSVIAGDFKYPADRWYCVNAAGGAGVMAGVQIDDNSGGNGTGKYLNISASTPDAALAAGDSYALSQWIEGLQVVDLYWGTASAKPITIAFEVAASAPGTGALSIRNSNVDRSYVATFPVGAAFAPVVVTIPGCVDAVWPKDTTRSMIITFALGVGATLQAPALNAWQNGNYTSHASASNFMAVGGNGFFIRNVRLYPGNVDYGPAQASYADDLIACLRYFQRAGSPGALCTPMAGVVAGPTALDFQFQTAQPLRAAPLMRTSGWAFVGAAPGAASNQIAAFSPTAQGWIASTHATVTPGFGGTDQMIQNGNMRLLGAGGAFGGANGQYVQLYMGGAAWIDFDAEF